VKKRAGWAARAALQRKEGALQAGRSAPKLRKTGETMRQRLRIWQLSAQMIGSTRPSMKWSDIKVLLAVLAIVVLLFADVTLFFWGLGKLLKGASPAAIVSAGVFFVGALMGVGYWIDRKRALSPLPQAARPTSDSDIKRFLCVLFAVFLAEMTLLLAYLTWLVPDPHSSLQELFWFGVMFWCGIGIFAAIDFFLIINPASLRRKPRIRADRGL
jgi:hypothetical protein